MTEDQQYYALLMGEDVFMENLIGACLDRNIAVDYPYLVLVKRTKQRDRTLKNWVKKDGIETNETTVTDRVEQGRACHRA